MLLQSRLISVAVERSSMTPCQRSSHRWLCLRVAELQTRRGAMLMPNGPLPSVPVWAWHSTQHSCALTQEGYGL